MSNIRFTDQPRETTPVAADAVVGTKAATGEDVHFTMEDIAAAMRVLLADALITPEERDVIETPPPVILLRYRWFRGATAPAVDANNADPGPGWSETLATGTDAVWQIAATFNNNVFFPPWSAPVKISGEAGLDGLPGEDGTPGNQYFFQNDNPSGTGRLVNDVWWDADDNFKQYRWDGTQWVPSFQPLLTLDEAGRVTGLVRAGESGKAFVLVASQFQVWNGTSAQVPFEILDNVVYIKEAVIRQIAAAKIIGGTITGQEIILSGTGSKLRSGNYVAGVSGWKIDGEGAEFPALVVRNGNIEANAVTRRYGGSFPTSAVIPRDTWGEVAGVDIVMAAGEFATIAVSFGFECDPDTIDADFRLLRADGSIIQGGSGDWTTRPGNTELITYNFFDTTVTTRYKLELRPRGGSAAADCVARSPTMIVIIYRK